jgi:hypothetical protein
MFTSRVMLVFSFVIAIFADSLPVAPIVAPIVHPYLF